MSTGRKAEGWNGYWLMVVDPTSPSAHSGPRRFFVGGEAAELSEWRSRLGPATVKPAGSLLDADLECALGVGQVHAAALTGVRAKGEFPPAPMPVDLRGRRSSFCTAYDSPFRTGTRRLHMQRSSRGEVFGPGSLSHGAYG